MRFLLKNLTLIESLLFHFWEFLRTDIVISFKNRAEQDPTDPPIPGIVVNLNHS